MFIQYCILGLGLSNMIVWAAPAPQQPAPDGYWTADIYQQGCHDAAEPQDNPEYTFTRQDSLPCTSIQGYGYQSVYFDDTTGGFVLNAYTDADCTVPLTQGFAGDGCITTPEGQYIVAISVDPR